MKREVETADWMETIAVKNRLAVDVLLDELDAGEAETIVLAREIGADWVLMDEKKGRRKLKQLGLHTMGTLGILLRAKQSGLLLEIHPSVERLHRQGFSLSKTVIDGVLRQAGESFNCN